MIIKREEYTFENFFDKFRIVFNNCEFIFENISAIRWKIRERISPTCGAILLFFDKILTFKYVDMNEQIFCSHAVYFNLEGLNEINLLKKIEIFKEQLILDFKTLIVFKSSSIDNK